MKTIQKLLQEVSTSRSLYLDQLANISEAQAIWKPDPEVWNVIEIIEHLFWAEQSGIFGMWKTLHAIRNGRIVRTYDSPHQDMTIEQIINKTWQAKEKVPAVAVPRLGGPLAFWKSSLISLEVVLEGFGENLQENELRIQAQPHPISGPLDFHQRLEFLRFHLDRHREQVSWLLRS